jgi:hypothetical protein
MEIQAKRSTWLVALAIVGTVFTGVVGFVGAIFAFFRLDATGFGVTIVGSALAFGLLANALLRD